MGSPDPRLPPLAGRELHVLWREIQRGAGFRQALERQLLELPSERAELLMQRLREGRAGWLPLLGVAAGRALLLGDALSGSALALGRGRFAAVVADDDPLRLAVARERDRQWGAGRVRFLRLDARRPLPFPDRSFDLVVDERGTPPEEELRELLRICRGELLAVADNRLGYKLSSGRRADFRVRGPWSFARHALRPAAGERTARGWRRALARAGAAQTEALALYPHRHDFSHVVALDRRGPRLTVGPQERRNRLKLAAERLGLFPWFAPSFGLRAAPGPLSPPRAAAWLETVAAALGEPVPRLEHLITTRGNTCVLLTAGTGDRGRWCLHLPLSPAQERQSRRHTAALRWLAQHRPQFPAPRPLWEGEVDGRYLCAEERLGGLSAPQLTGQLAAAERTYGDLAEALALLVIEREVELDGARLAALLDAKLAAVAPRCGHGPTAAALTAMARSAADRLHGLRVPLVLYHADLRAKHVQVDDAGGLLGVLDWGSHEQGDLPYFDLLNLVIHDRKQQSGSTVAAAWRSVVEGRLRPFERRALDRHARLLGLPERYVSTLEATHPLLVGAMAESNWDYSRPRWIHAGFGL